MKNVHEEKVLAEAAEVRIATAEKLAGAFQRLTAQFVELGMTRQGAIKATSQLLGYNLEPDSIRNEEEQQRPRRAAWRRSHRLDTFRMCSRSQGLEHSF